ncbi:MAG: TonB family protein [Gemmatimonadetes bacterium]|nr:TonB family protein [Gemmatimonadota bacterium]
MQAQTTRQQRTATESANGRFKNSFSSWFWSSMIAATMVHFGFFAYLEFAEPPDLSLNGEPPEVINLPPDVELPPAPEAIARPATPVIAPTDIETDITIAPTTFTSLSVDDLLEPPGEVELDVSAAPVIVPYTVEPDYTNAAEVMRALEREYPPLLRDAGIGGTVQVWFFIDENGAVQNQLVQVTSGHTALDEAALRVAPVFRFTPALNRDKAVPVWVSLPITFRTN